VMINIDPHTAERDARVLKTVAQTRDNYAGVYASVERPGAIRLGDPVSVLP
jgi:MOSC domain-containing protein YiiM